jgi:hypothetical protein
MKRPETVRRTSAGLLAALLIAVAVLGLGASPAAAKNAVPFSASFAGAAIAAPDFSSVTFSGSGHATQLGVSTSAGYLVLTAAPSPCAGGVPNDQYETFTAANGDTLSIISTDVGCPVDATGFRFHGTGNWTVTGGTGRFSDATGSGTLEGHADFLAGTFSFDLTGSIAY